MITIIEGWAEMSALLLLCGQSENLRRLVFSFRGDCTYHYYRDTGYDKACQNVQPSHGQPSFAYPK
jgi:hypothetical protein